MITDRRKEFFLLMVAAVCIVFAASMSAQVNTQTTTTAQPTTVVTSVERGEVVYVGPRELVVKMEDGTLRDFQHISPDVKVNVDGQELGIQDLKVGMKLQKTVSTSTTPKMITTTQTVSGTVFHVTPPKTVILRLDDGSNQQFNIPEGQTFTIDGQTVDAFHLKKGMKISATKVVETPVVQQAQATTLQGTMPPPPPADAPILVAVLTPVPAPAAAAPASENENSENKNKLPNTASWLPLIGLLGSLSFAGSLGLKLIRRLW